MNKTLSALGRVLVTVLMIILIGYSWAFVELKILLKPLPELFGYIFYVQTDDTMSPDFNADDVIVSKIGQEYRVGQKVLIMDEGKFMVRVATDNSGEMLKVKSVKETDEVEVDKSKVIGVSIAKIKGFNKFIKFFKQKWFLVTLALLGFAFIVFSQRVREAPKQVKE